MIESEAVTGGLEIMESFADFGGLEIESVADFWGLYMESEGAIGGQEL